MNKAWWRYSLPLALAIGLVSTTPALAQSNATREDNGIGFGVLAGVTRDTFKNSDLEDFFKTKTGTMFGLWVGGNKNGLIGFTGEFNYLTRKVGEQDSDNEYKMHVLEIPAVFHVNIGQRTRNGVMGYGLVGPVFSFNLKSELNGVDVGDNFNGADVGVMAGAGFEAYRIAVEGRGNWGLRNISDSGDVSNTKTFSLEFLVKFRIN
jgi:hypothetical protein